MRVDIMSWKNILKTDEELQQYKNNPESADYYWPRPKKLFERRPNRNLGYIMSYWYLHFQDEVDEWIQSDGELEGIHIDKGNRVKDGYRHAVGGYYIFKRTKLQAAIDENKELLEKYGIAANVDAFIEAVASKGYQDEDIYNFIATQFGDTRMRADNPLRIHRRNE